MLPYQTGIDAAIADHYQRTDAMRDATHLYSQMKQQLMFNRMKHIMTLKQRGTMMLDTLHTQLRGGHYVGLQEVAIEDIVGSESRQGDFDSAFRLIADTAQARQRWINLAMAWLEGVALPAVELLQVGCQYFVRDGHHRISIARMVGQTYIDAEVTHWD